MLAWPIVLARATQAVIGFCDALMVAPLGEAALAATTTGGLNVFCLIILPMGTVFIVQSFAAQLRGRGELGRARRYAYYGLSIAALSAALGAPLIAAMPAFMGLFQFAPDVQELSSDYMSIRLLAVGAAVGTEALGNWYGGLGNTRLYMVAGIVAMVSNVLGNYLLIEPRFGLPGYGVSGAAWASVAGSWLGFLVTLVAFGRAWGYQKQTGPLGLNWREFYRTLRFGIPNGVNWFLEFVAFVLFINVVVAQLGTTVLAAFNVVIQLNAISFMPVFGLASAGAIMAGEAIGRRALDGVWPVVRATLGTAGIWMLLTGALYVAVPKVLFGFFALDGSSAERMVEVGALMLMISAGWQLFDAMGMTFSETLRAAGDTTWCMWARVVVAWFVFTPIAWTLVLVWGGGVLTMMLSMVGYMVVLSTTFALRFATGRWRNIEMVEAEPQLL